MNIVFLYSNEGGLLSMKNSVHYAYIIFVQVV